MSIMIIKLMNNNDVRPITMIVKVITLAERKVAMRFSVDPSTQDFSDAS